MIYLVIFLLSHSFVLADQESYGHGKQLAEQLNQGIQNSVPEGIPTVQPDQVKEGRYLEEFHEMSERATEMTHNSEMGEFVIESQKTRKEEDYRVTEDSDIVQNANEIVADPMKYIGGGKEREERGEQDVVETTHLCEESGDPETYTCEQTRIVTPKEVEEGEIEIKFWYKPQDFSPMLNMNIITDTALYGNQWNQGGSPRAKDMSGGVSTPFPEELRDHITSINLKAPLTNPCGGGSMSFDDKGNFYYRGSCNAGYHHRTHYGTAIVKYRRTTAKRYWRTHVYGQAIHRAHHHHGPPGYGHDQFYDFYAYTPNREGFSRGHFDGCGTYWWNEVIEYKDYDLLLDDPNADRIDDQCSALERRANSGLCVYGKEEILEGPGEKTFKKGDTTLVVSRDWWKRRLTYHCKYPSKDSCGSFRSAGCDQVKASCLKRIEGVCVNNQKTFLCRSVALGNGKVRFKVDVPYCMDGNCDDHSWAGNKDFADAMSKLSLFKEISEDMNVDKTNATIFRGNAKKCSKATLSFQDCCGSGGWGRSVGLGQNCDDDEKELKKERSANKCVRVGTYCAHRSLLGFCEIKKTSFCCFGSKLSKILQEQGRSQLGIGWGDAEHPDCRPFTIDEIQRIDFSRIDFSSLYEELRAKTNVENVATAAEGMGGRWSEKVKAAQSKHGKKVTPSELYNTKENPDASL
ncbi:MAG: conjugal transfer protein TraN [Simkaniaceae bacterium]|nr:conjugal transfer protein TraN [Simkaniaceae bacterium]